MSRSSSAVAAELKARSISSSLPRDILSFLLHYPGQSPDPVKKQNALFYLNKAPARPRRSNSEQLQAELRGNWGELEGRHDFIQWFFPIREQGVNWEAQPLELHEVDTIKEDKEAMERLLESYRIILAFYGLRLVSPTTGELALEDSIAAPDPASYLRRFRNLEHNSHNFLRVTRILKCLGEFGLTQHPPSLLLFILHLQSPSGGGHLSSSSLTRSMDGYWRHCVRDDSDRQFVAEMTEKVRKGGEWTGNDYQAWINRRASERSAEVSGTEDEVESAV